MHKNNDPRGTGFDRASFYPIINDATKGAFVIAESPFERMGNRVLGYIVAFALGALLTGCTGNGVTPSPQPTPDRRLPICYAGHGCVK